VREEYITLVLNQIKTFKTRNKRTSEFQAQCTYSLCLNFPSEKNVKSSELCETLCYQKKNYTKPYSGC